MQIRGLKVTSLGFSKFERPKLFSPQSADLNMPPRIIVSLVKLDLSGETSGFGVVRAEEQGQHLLLFRANPHLTLRVHQATRMYM